jgi:cyclopropane fatty-acyl-phospholipid synthase-like methyltransferase
MVAVFGQAAIEAAAPAAGERVLDIGCGAGASMDGAVWIVTARNPAS